MDVQPYVWIYAKPGMYKFLIQTKEYKDIIVKDVKVIKEKTDFIAIYETDLIPKEFRVGIDTVRIIDMNKRLIGNIRVINTRFSTSPIYQIPRSDETPAISLPKIQENPK